MVVDTRYDKQINPQAQCQCSYHPRVFQGIEFPRVMRSELVKKQEHPGQG